MVDSKYLDICNPDTLFVYPDIANVRGSARAILQHVASQYNEKEFARRVEKRISAILEANEVKSEFVVR